jgi:ferredoxin-NADP reductase
MKEEIKKRYKVVLKIKETSDVCTLQLEIEGEKIIYKSGQFITVYFPELGTPEGKAYSISSAPSEEYVSITVKSMGAFSKRLCSLKKGDYITASLPYGYFFTENDETDLVLIAGGIGIAPFRSMIVDSIANLQKRKIILFYSNQKVDDIIYLNELNKISKLNKNIVFKYFITRQEKVSLGYQKGRIKIADLIEENKKNSEFMICGSISFVRDFWKGLKDSGISEDALYTEAFFSH